MTETVRLITEEPTAGPSPTLTHAGWTERFPWLVQGTTLRGSDDTFDLGLFGLTSTGAVQDRWRTLLSTTGFESAVHGRQVHGAHVVCHRADAPGLRITGPCDGHVTSHHGTLLTVSTADCVPISVVDAKHRAIALLHAGWRGAAASILEVGVDVLADAYSTEVVDLHVHLGPAICGACYEVGPEVHLALGLPSPPGPTPVDLRRNLVHRAIALGVPARQISTSAHCTRCGEEALFSHRAGDTGRQISFLGVRPNPW